MRQAIMISPGVIEYREVPVPSELKQCTLQDEFIIPYPKFGTN